MHHLSQPSNSYGQQTVLSTCPLQDLGLAQNAAITTKTITPLGALALQMYNLMCQHNYGQKDFSSVFEFMERKDL